MLPSVPTIDPKAQQLNQQGAELANQGQWRQACDYFTRALDYAPQSPELRLNLARVLLSLDRQEEAIGHLHTAVRLDPQRRDSLDGAARAYHRMGRTAEFIVFLQSLLSQQVDSAALRYHLAGALLREGRAELAGPHAEAAIAQSPRDVALRRELAQLALDNHVPGTAVILLQGALAVQGEHQGGRDSGLQAMLVDALLRDGQLAEADALARQLRTNHPDDARGLISMARVHLARQAPEQAETLLRAARDLEHGAEAEAELLRVYQLTGQGTQATSQPYDPNNLDSVHRQIVSNRFHIGADLEQAAEQILRRPLLSDNNRYALQSALARVLDTRGDATGALARMAPAQAIAARIHPYDPQKFEQLIEAIISSFDQSLMTRLEGSGDPSRRPVFILGMPRSGTSLLEQILAAHPQVFAAGELNFAAQATQANSGGDKYPDYVDRLTPDRVAGAARDYLHHIATLNRDALRLTDKLPHNFLRVGLLHLMFPNATIIHVQRDVRDIAASNYFARFGLRGDLMAYHSTIEGIAHHILQYQRLMEHWRTLLPGRLLEIRYEDLVNDLPAIATRALQTMGLDWDERVLDFHQLHRPVDTASSGQVNQPVYQSSVGRWKRYGEGADNPFNSGG